MTDPKIEAAVTEWKRQIDKISLEKTGKAAKWTDPEILTNIRNAMGSALAAADAAAWREIATAPTDSSEVLVWDGDSVSIAGRMGKYWWSDVGYSIDNATHWQPLPAPPDDDVKA